MDHHRAHRTRNVVAVPRTSRFARGVVASLALASVALAAPQASNIAGQDLSWSAPSHDASGSMPIGNGELGANVWVEENGDLCLLLSRTDAWSECERLLKLARIRIAFDPPLAGEGLRFRQVLRLEQGSIEIESGEGVALWQLALFVEDGASRVRLVADGPTARRVRVVLEDWRTAPQLFTNKAVLASSWAMQSAPDEIAAREAFESADVVVDMRENALGWYHHNEHSIVPFTLEHQGLTSVANAFPDPLLSRTFGGWIEGSGLVRQSAHELASRTALTHFELTLAAPCMQTEPATNWIEAARALARSSTPIDEARAASAAWWSAFWERSWIEVGGDPSVGVPQNAHPLRFGADSNGENVFHGLVSRASLYSRALTPTEIARLAGERLAPDPSVAEGLVANLVKDGVRIGAVTSVKQQWMSALSLDGGHLELADKSALEHASGLSFEAWIRPEGGGRLFDSLSAGGSDGFLFDLWQDGLRAIVGTRTLAEPKGLARGRWVHVAASWDTSSGALALYADGKRIAGRVASESAVPSRVTQAYVLQRWVAACGGRGAYPIKFNGSIFTVEPRFTEGQPNDPDWRKWGGDFWWQNTRLPYAPMLAQGSLDSMQPLFDFYRSLLPSCEARAALYHDAHGAYFPETITTFGTYANGDYGWDRSGAPANEVHCPWWQWAWGQGLELSALMLDAYDYGGDERFLSEEVLPLADSVLGYFDSRFHRDPASGRLVIDPTQAIETYWHGVVNDMPCVAGLRAVSERLWLLPAKFGTNEERLLWKRMYDSAPDLPVRTIDGQRALAPAERYADERSNCETPELYAVWPFKLAGIGRGDLAAAKLAYQNRVDHSHVGWTQDGIFAAHLGLVDDAKEDLLARAGNSHPNFRFPAMWGPNFDWLPDQDHGSNLMTLLQSMLLQSWGDKLYVLPCWPDDWDVSFKLHAPHQTTVECEFKKGKLERLVVTPRERQRDVVTRFAQ